MGEVLVALTPTLFGSIYLFGARALVVTGICVSSCFLFEWLFCIIAGRESSVKDLSACVTGVILAFNLPVYCPLWMPVIGAAFAIVITKMLFGGLGQNFLNPALAARVFLASAWSADMVRWTRPVLSPFAWTLETDIITAATPLANIRMGDSLPKGFGGFGHMLNMLLGVKPGCIGETCGFLLIAGGAYLIARKVIDWQIPACYIGVTGILAMVFPFPGVGSLTSAYYSIFTGGILLGAIFMATDYVTSPLLDIGKAVYGVGCGVITFFIRKFGSSAEGVSYAILIMNVLVWFIDRYIVPRRFGQEAIR